MRLYGLEVGDRIILNDLRYAVEFNHETDLRAGASLFSISGHAKLVHTIDKIDPPPLAEFLIIAIEYKSKFHKLFRKYIKESIAYIEIECWGLM